MGKSPEGGTQREERDQRESAGKEKNSDLISEEGKEGKGSRGSPFDLSLTFCSRGAIIRLIYGCCW